MQVPTRSFASDLKNEPPPILKNKLWTEQRNQIAKDCDEIDAEAFMSSLVENLPQELPDTIELIKTCYDAAYDEGPNKYNKGRVASLVHATMAVCGERDTKDGAWKACELLEWMEEEPDEYDEFPRVNPDTVSYSLAYAAMIAHDESAAEDILKRSQQWAKKQAGGARRKAMAAAKRTAKLSATEQLEKLREILQTQDFAVIDETEDYIVLNKPSGVVCYHSHKTSAGKVRKGSSKNKKGDKKEILADVSLVDALLHCHVPLSTLNPQAQGIVHRTDRGTSGCILLAKTDAFHAKAVSQFFVRAVEKQYHAMVVAPIDSSLVERDTKERSLIEMPVDGKPAQSKIECLWLREVQADSKEILALIAVWPLTGRQHQVRVHAARGMGTPVVGDALYGDLMQYPEFIKGLWEEARRIGSEGERGKERFMLHAESLNLVNLGIHATSEKPAFWKPFTGS